MPVMDPAKRKEYQRAYKVRLLAMYAGVRAGAGVNWKRGRAVASMSEEEYAGHLLEFREWCNKRDLCFKLCLVKVIRRIMERRP